MFNQLYFLVITVIALCLGQSNEVLAEESSQLFFLDPTVKSKHEAILPLTQSVKEWDILFNFEVVNAKQKSLLISLPEDNESLYVVQSYFHVSELGHIQWVGKALSNKGKESGTVLINVVNGEPFVIITFKNSTYEIYTDSRVGSRLAKIESGSSMKNDVAAHNDLNSGTSKLVKNYHENNRLKSSGNPPSNSVVDVLVIFDDDLFGNTSAANKIISEFSNANFILQNSGENAVNSSTDIGGGVPLRLNMIGPQYMDIPDEYENIKVNFSSYNYLTNGQSVESFTIKQMLLNSGADYVAIYTDFDPDVVTSGSLEICGAATVPSSSAQDSSFKASVTLNSAHCSLSQYVLIHELVHNFGSRHDSDTDDETIPYVTYARGMNIPSSKTNNAFATLMAGCSGETSNSGDPSVTNCGRIPKLSSPLDTNMQQVLGEINAIDNARFLSECEVNGPCRREEIANRQSINSNIDFAPTISINLPAEPITAVISANSNYVLTANVMEDFDGAVVNWEIRTLPAGPTAGILLDSGNGVGENYSFTTQVFSNPGGYRIWAKVTDSSGQSKSVGRVVTVTADVPMLTLAKTTWGNHYAIELQGENFVSDASVQFRENIQGSMPLATFQGDFIYNRGMHPTLNVERLIFPIVDPSQQAKLRTNGLCFKVLNGTNESNEICTVRSPLIQPQGEFLGSPVESYVVNQDPQYDTFIVKNAGSVIKLFGNSWKKVAYNYNITANTILEFNFKSTHQEAEIIGIGVIMSDGSGGGFSQRFWQIHGTQNYGIQDFHNYSGNQEVTYRIPIGEKLTGQISHIVFVADEDNRVGQNVVFLSPKFKLQGADDYDDPITGIRSFDDDVNGRSKLWINPSVNDDVHNLHDQGDVDWTVIYAEDFKVRTELIGTNILPRISLYKWISATHNNTLGYFTFVNDILLNTSNNSWQTPLINYATESDSYAIKVESPTAQFGLDTEYKLIFEGIEQGSPDVYENSTLLTDDHEGTPVMWQGATDTIHYQNFHDNNDVDWTLVYTPRLTAHAVAIGDAADIKMSVYRWDSADLVNGVFVNIDKQLVGTDWSSGDSTVSINTNQADTYLIKIESRNGAYGNNTNYSLRLY